MNEPQNPGEAAPKRVFHSVDAYLAALPAPAQEAVRALRTVLREAVPEAEECISYQIPSLRVRGKLALSFAGYPHHCALYPASEQLRADLGAALDPYLTGKATLRFPLDAPLPLDLIRRIARHRADETAAEVRRGR